MKPIIPAGNTQIITEQKLMENSFRTFLSALSDMYPLLGAGSPEGVVEAQQLKFYMDTAGLAGAVLYIKQDSSIGGDKTLGWILV